MEATIQGHLRDRVSQGLRTIAQDMGHYIPVSSFMREKSAPILSKPPLFQLFSNMQSNIVSKLK